MTRRVRTTVLAYHAIGACPPEHDPHNLWVATASFERQMDYLARRRRVVSLDDLVAGGLGPGPPAVAITFDDAYRSVLEAAAPILSSHRFPATVFTPTRWIGDRNRWDDPTPCALPIMGEDELRAVEALGVAVESHGHGHLDLAAASVEEAQADLEASCRRLTTLLGRPPRHLAFPFSDGSAAARRVAEELGFAAAYSIDRPGDGPYSRGRVQVAPSDGPALFALKTSGVYLGLRHAPAVAGGWRLVGSVVGRRRRW